MKHFELPATKTPIVRILGAFGEAFITDDGRMEICFYENGKVYRGSKDGFEQVLCPDRFQILPRERSSLVIDL
jgi:hypothetical protein